MSNVCVPTQLTQRDHWTNTRVPRSKTLYVIQGSGFSLGILQGMRARTKVTGSLDRLEGQSPGKKLHPPPPTGAAEQHTAQSQSHLSFTGERFTSRSQSSERYNEDNA